MPQPVRRRPGSMPMMRIGWVLMAPDSTTASGRIPPCRHCRSRRCWPPSKKHFREDARMLGPNAWLMVAGAGLVLVGILIRFWSGRYDLKDIAVESAWTFARGRRTADNPTAIEAKLRDIQAQKTWTGRATKTAGTAVLQVVAQAIGKVPLVVITAGSGLAAAGLLWR